MRKIEEHKRAANKLAEPAMQVQKYAAAESEMKTRNTRKTQGQIYQNYQTRYFQEKPESNVFQFVDFGL